MFTQERRSFLRLGFVQLLATSSLVALAFAVVLGVMHRADGPASGPVYTVAAITALLGDHPAASINRTVQVRARPAACLLGMEGPGTPCSERQPVLVDATPGLPTAALSLVRGHATPLLALLRRLPQVGRLVPAPHAVRWGDVATFRVRLRASANSSCGTGVCYEAVLLDAAP